MTFAVRTITRSATGGDIVHRPQRFEADAIVVGRGSDCEIRLADLAVNLRHAKLRRTAPYLILAESISAEPFEVAGKFVTRAELNLSDKPRLTFGSHVLTLSASEENGDVLVDVTRQESAPETASAINERKIFSLGSSPIGKREFAWTLALIAILVGLVWPVAAFVSHQNRTIHADQQWSTGPLSRAHAFLGKNCQACHVKAFVSVRDETCLSCHQSTANPEAARLVAANERNWGGPEKVDLIREHAAHDRLIRATPLPKDLVGKIKVLFQRQFDHTTDRCASCHLEHLADTPPKGTTQTPPHPRAIPVLVQVNDCASCHAKLRRSLGSTALRDTPDWTHHPEFRPLIARTPIGQSQPVLDRISLLEQPTDYTGLIFSHQEHLSPTGGVARMAAGLGFSGGMLKCADCHHPSKGGLNPGGSKLAGPNSVGPNSIGKGDFARVEMVRDCSSCHSLAYAPGAGASAMTLPHGRPDQVIAAMQAYYQGGGTGSGMEGGGRQPPGFLARMGMFFTGVPRHADTSVSSAKIRALFAPKGLCSECHTPVAPADASSLDFKIKPIHLTDRYLPRGAFDHSVPEHKQDAAGNPTCDTCHKAANSSNPSEVLLPRVSQCATCHGRTKEKISTAASGDCTECHSFHAPGMATPKSEQHPVAASVSVSWAPKTKALALASNKREF